MKLFSYFLIRNRKHRRTIPSKPELQPGTLVVYQNGAISSVQEAQSRKDIRKNLEMSGLDDNITSGYVRGVFGDIFTVDLETDTKYCYQQARADVGRLDAYKRFAKIEFLILGTKPGCDVQDVLLSRVQNKNYIREIALRPTCVTKKAVVLFVKSKERKIVAMLLDSSDMVNCISGKDLNIMENKLILEFYCIENDFCHSIQLSTIEKATSSTLTCSNLKENTI